MSPGIRIDYKTLRAVIAVAVPSLALSRSVGRGLTISRRTRAFVGVDRFVVFALKDVQLLA